MRAGTTSAWDDAQSRSAGRGVKIALLVEMPEGERQVCLLQLVKFPRRPIISGVCRLRSTVKITHRIVWCMSRRNSKCEVIIEEADTLVVPGGFRYEAGETVGQDAGAILLIGSDQRFGHWRWRGTGGSAGKVCGDDEHPDPASWDVPTACSRTRTDLPADGQVTTAYDLGYGYSVRRWRCRNCAKIARTPGASNSNRRPGRGCGHPASFSGV